jgi:hypothetical protein
MGLKSETFDEMYKTMGELQDLVGGLFEEVIEHNTTEYPIGHAAQNLIDKAGTLRNAIERFKKNYVDDDKMNITEFEQAILDSFEEDDYMFLDHVYGYALKRAKMTPQQLPGVVSSLVKKGLVGVEKRDGDEAIWLTKLGKQHSNYS